jgi:hypothetical protein
MAFRQEAIHQVAADKTGTAGHKTIHGPSILRFAHQI